MYKNSRTTVRVEGVRSEWFDVNIGVQQSSILSPFLFAVVLDKITKDVRGGLLKEILYADDFMLLGNSWEEVEERYSRLKKAFKEKALKVNVDKTKVFCTGEKVMQKLAIKYLCAICRKGVGVNIIIQCRKCKKWVHKKCSN